MIKKLLRLFFILLCACLITDNFCYAEYVPGQSTYARLLRGDWSFSKVLVDNLTIDLNTLSSTAGKIILAPLSGQDLELTPAGAGNINITANDLEMAGTVRLSSAGIATLTQATIDNITIDDSNISSINAQPLYFYTASGDIVYARSTAGGTYFTVATATDQNGAFNITENGIGKFGVQHYADTNLTDIFGLVNNNGFTLYESGRTDIVSGNNGDIYLTPNGTGIVKIDNLGFDANTISSTDTNGNITLTPNGTGVVQLANNSITSSSTDTYFDLNTTGSTSIAKIQFKENGVIKSNVGYDTNNNYTKIGVNGGGYPSYIIYDTGKQAITSTSSQDIELTPGGNVNITANKLEVGGVECLDQNTQFTGSIVNRTVFRQASADILATSGQSSVNTTNGAVDLDLPATTTANTTVDADSAAGQKVLNTTATTNFAVNDTVLIGDGTATEETGVVASIQAGVSLTLVSNMTYTHTAVAANTVYALASIGREITVYLKTFGAGNNLTVTCDDANDKIMSAGTGTYTTLTMSAAGSYATLRKVAPYVYLLKDSYGVTAS